MFFLMIKICFFKDFMNFIRFWAGIWMESYGILWNPINIDVFYPKSNDYYGFLSEID